MRDRDHLLRLAGSGLFALALLAPAAAWAQAVTVTPSPTALSLPAGRTTPTFTVRYTAAGGVAGAGSIPAPLTASRGEFRLSPTGPSIGPTTPALAISMPTDANSLLILPVSTTDRFRVPDTVVAAARQAGAATIYYFRNWTFPQPPTVPPVNIPTTVLITFTGGLGGPFQVTRFQLQFDDRSELRIAQQLQRFRAVANVNYSGVGVIDAVWEVSSAAQSRSLQSQTGFRILKRLRRRLDGSGRIFLESPFLPSNESGLHLVRLRFIVPETAFDLPAIRYFVSQGTSPTFGGVPAPLRLAAPPHMGEVDAETRFAWAGAAGAAAYQVEVFAGQELRAESTRPEASLETTQQRQIQRSLLLADPQPASGRFVTGTVLPAAETSFTLSEPMLAQLQPGRRYFWRVRAIGADGSVVAQSPLHEVLLSRSVSIPAPATP